MLGAKPQFLAVKGAESIRTENQSLLQRRLSNISNTSHRSKLDRKQSSARLSVSTQRTDFKSSKGTPTTDRSVSRTSSTASVTDSSVTTTDTDSVSRRRGSGSSSGSKVSKRNSAEKRRGNNFEKGVRGEKDSKQREAEKKLQLIREIKR